MPHTFWGGPSDGATTEETRQLMVMPIHDTDRVAYYIRRYQGDYFIYATGPEEGVLGAILLDEPESA